MIGKLHCFFARGLCKFRPLDNCAAIPWQHNSTSMFARTGKFPGLLLALCVAASGCPNWNIRGRARLANPPDAGPALAIQTPPHSNALKLAENKTAVRQAEPTTLQIAPPFPDNQKPVPPESARV